MLKSSGIVIYRIRSNILEYLILHYFPAGHWDLPKGNIESGETKRQAALRELKEETGLTAAIHDNFQEDISYAGQYNGADFFKTVYFFVGEVDPSSKVTLSSEHQAFVWLPYEQALEKLTYDNAKAILQKAHRFILLLIN
ncbi:NUDIX domain-containing protein [Candidatus Dependentiae bacterium]|nr:NUDIX domain-containing protein [Candidatus Dependentiae bacterium]